MSTHNKPYHRKLSQIHSYGIFSKGLKNEFETVVVKEPLMFKPLKFYCNMLMSNGHLFYKQKYLLVCFELQIVYQSYFLFILF